MLKVEIFSKICAGVISGSYATFRPLSVKILVSTGSTSSQINTESSKLNKIQNEMRHIIH